MPEDILCPRIYLFVIVVWDLVMEFPGNSHGFGGKLVLFSRLSSVATWSMAAHAQHWTVGEKGYMFELVSTQINVIEDKRSDTNAHKKKMVVWEGHL